MDLSRAAAAATPYSDTVWGTLLSGLVGALVGGLITGLAVWLTLKHERRLADDQRLRDEIALVYGHTVQHSLLMVGSAGLMPGSELKFKDTGFELGLQLIRVSEIVRARIPELSELLEEGRKRLNAENTRVSRLVRDTGGAVADADWSTVEEALTRIQVLLAVQWTRKDRRQARRVLKRHETVAGAFDDLHDIEPEEVTPPPDGPATG